MEYQYTGLCAKCRNKPALFSGLCANCREPDQAVEFDEASDDEAVAVSSFAVRALSWIMLLIMCIGMFFLGLAAWHRSTL